MMTSAIVRVMLIADMVVMALLALVYLRQRRMSWLAYLGWGALAIAVPVIGPFIVISNRPGEWDPSFSVQRDISRLLMWLRRMLPEPARGNSRLTRARSRRQVRQQR
ncbi:MAG: hypothetical protein IH586_22650 [Anaerolineaceae bacterium]|nr:hypothetical protein [Anaerolineaceae bacterium]